MALSINELEARIKTLEAKTPETEILSPSTSEKVLTVGMTVISVTALAASIYFTFFADAPSASE